MKADFAMAFLSVLPFDDILTVIIIKSEYKQNLEKSNVFKRGDGNRQNINNQPQGK